jgi:hypothetical protein
MDDARTLRAQLEKLEGRLSAIEARLDDIHADLRTVVEESYAHRLAQREVPGLDQVAQELRVCLILRGGLRVRTSSASREQEREDHQSLHALDTTAILAEVRVV